MGKHCRLPASAYKTPVSRVSGPLIIIYRIQHGGLIHVGVYYSSSSRQPYVMFAKVNLTESYRRNPNISNRDVMCQVATMWSDLSETEKEVRCHVM